MWSLKRCSRYRPSFIFLLSTIVFSQAIAQNASLELTSQEIRYYAPGADNVVLVWGIDGWGVAPEAARSSGTTVVDGVMRTPMEIQDDFFVTTVQIPLATTLHYGFLVTTLQDAGLREMWEADGEQGFHIFISRDSTIEVRSRLLSNLDAELASQEIRYVAPGAGEVYLVWGVNGWANAPENARPSGTEVKDSLMHTPMHRKDDTFSTVLALPPDSQVDFVFRISRTSNNVDSEVWDTNSEQDYSVVAGRESVLEIEADPWAIDGILAYGFDVTSLWRAILLLSGLVILGVLSIVELAPIMAGLESKYLVAKAVYRVSLPVVKTVVYSPFIVVLMFLLYLAVGLFQSPVLLQVLGGEFRFWEGNQYIFRENSAVELITFGSLMAGGLRGLFLAGQIRNRRQGALAVSFYSLFSVALIFIAMEEVAWGQWFLGFETPAAVEEVNLQGELTLHNLGGFQGHSEILVVLFGLGGLFGIWLSRLNTFKMLAAPEILFSWFFLIFTLAGLDLANDYIAIHRFFDWFVRQLVEVVEMMVGISGFLFIWLNARMITCGDNGSVRRPIQSDHSEGPQRITPK